MFHLLQTCNLSPSQEPQRKHSMHDCKPLTDYNFVIILMLLRFIQKECMTKSKFTTTRIQYKSHNHNKPQPNSCTRTTALNHFTGNGNQLTSCLRCKNYWIHLPQKLSCCLRVETAHLQQQCKQGSTEQDQFPGFTKTYHQTFLTL